MSGSAAERRAVLFMGPFPPPVHGASAVTAALADQVEHVLPIIRVDLAPSGRSGFRYHLGRAVRHVEAVICTAKARKHARALYLSLPAGLGMVYSVPVLLTARAFGYEIFLHHHSYAYIVNRNFLASLTFRSAGKRHKSIVLSDEMGDELRDRYRSIAATRTLSNAWLVKDCPARVPVAGPRRVIGHLSNLCLEKGIDTVIDVFDRLAFTEGGWTLHIAGPFADSAAEALVEEAVRRHRGQVTYHGPIYGAAKDSFFREIDAFLFPSRYVNEAEPVVLDEALAAGCGIVATRIGCSNESNFGKAAVELLHRGASADEYVIALLDLAQRRELSVEAQNEHRSRGFAAEIGLRSFVAYLAAEPPLVAVRSRH